MQRLVATAVIIKLQKPTHRCPAAIKQHNNRISPCFRVRKLALAVSAALMDLKGMLDDAIKQLSEISCWCVVMCGWDRQFASTWPSITYFVALVYPVCFQVLVVMPPNQPAPQLSCPQGLTTRFTGARSIQQCFTSPGYGRTVSMSPEGVITYTATLCPVGTYNTGGNPAGCQSCPAGLTTNGTGASASSSCCKYKCSSLTSLTVVRAFASMLSQ